MNFYSGSAKEPATFLKTRDILIACISGPKDITDTGMAFDILYQELNSLICGCPFCMFTEQLSREGLRIRYCVPVTHMAVKNMIDFVHLPGTTMVSMMHDGPQNLLGESWEILFDFIYRKNLRTGIWRREIYLNYRSGKPNTGSVELQVSICPDK